MVDPSLAHPSSLSHSDASDILDVDKNTGKIKSSMERVQDIFKSIVQ